MQPWFMFPLAITESTDAKICDKIYVRLETFVPSTSGRNKTVLTSVHFDQCNESNTFISQPPYCTQRLLTLQYTYVRVSLCNWATIACEFFYFNWLLQLSRPGYHCRLFLQWIQFITVSVTFIGRFTRTLHLLACFRCRLFSSRPWLWRGPSIPCSHIQDWPGAATPRLFSQCGLGCRHRNRWHHVAGACGQIMGPRQHQVRPQLMPLQQGQLQSNSHWHWTREHRKR